MQSCLKLYCTHRIELIITQESFFLQTVLHLNVPERKCPVADTRSLNQRWLLSCTELNFLLASYRATLCWCLQGHPQTPTTGPRGLTVQRCQQTTEGASEGDIPLGQGRMMIREYQVPHGKTQEREVENLRVKEESQMLQEPGCTSKGNAHIWKLRVRRGDPRAKAAT